MSEQEFKEFDKERKELIRLERRGRILEYKRGVELYKKGLRQEKEKAKAVLKAKKELIKKKIKVAKQIEKTSQGLAKSFRAIGGLSYSSKGQRQLIKAYYSQTQQSKPLENSSGYFKGDRKPLKQRYL